MYQVPHVWMMMMMMMMIMMTIFYDCATIIFYYVLHIHRTKCFFCSASLFSKPVFLFLIII